jgi:hypothetical protein
MRYGQYLGAAFGGAEFGFHDSIHAGMFAVDSLLIQQILTADSTLNCALPAPE